MLKYAGVRCYIYRLRLLHLLHPMLFFFKFTSSVIAGVGIIDKMQMLHSLGYR